MQTVVPFNYCFLPTAWLKILAAVAASDGEAGSASHSGHAGNENFCAKHNSGQHYLGVSIRECQFFCLLTYYLLGCSGTLKQ